MDILKTLATEFKLKEEQVEKTVALMDEGNTIPFIARYRKEVTGSLDDVTLRDLFDRLTYLRNMEKRREEIYSLIEAQGKMTPEIAHALQNAKALVELEDIYLPYRPKRKTRASVARDKGLEPLAALIFEQRDTYEKTFAEEAQAYVDEEKGVATAEEALAGASDIIDTRTPSRTSSSWLPRRFEFMLNVPFMPYLFIMPIRRSSCVTPSS